MLENDLVKKGNSKVAKKTSVAFDAVDQHVEISPVSDYYWSDMKHADSTCSSGVTTTAQYLHNRRHTSASLSPAQARWLRIGEQLGRLLKRIKTGHPEDDGSAGRNSREVSGRQI